MDNNAQALRTDNTSKKHISIGYLGPKILAPTQIKILSGIKKVADEHDITLFHFGGPYPHDPKEVISQSSYIYELINPNQIRGIIAWSSQLYNDNGFFLILRGFWIRIRCFLLFLSERLSKIIQLL